PATLDAPRRGRGLPQPARRTSGTAGRPAAAFGPGRPGRLSRPGAGPAEQRADVPDAGPPAARGAQPRLARRPEGAARTPPRAAGAGAPVAPAKRVPARRADRR